MLRYVVRSPIKFILKDKSSLVSLEVNRSSISRTLKGQNHVFYSVSSNEVASGIVSGAEVALWQPCLLVMGAPHPPG